MTTLDDLVNRVQSDMDLQEEDFILKSDIVSWINEGISKAANIISTTYEDYFLTKSTISLISGVQDYSLPENMLAHKIRRIFYINGDTKYKLCKLNNLDDFLTNIDSTRYSYLFFNPESGLVISILKTPSESGPYLHILYLRIAKKLLLDTDTLDIPIGEDYVIQYAKDMCYNKEAGTPNAPPSPALLEKEKILIETLTNRTPDGDNSIQIDTSYYEEQN